MGDHAKMSFAVFLSPFYPHPPHPSTRAEKAGTATCVGCGSEIHDQYILKVSPDLEWHAACLKCADCSQYLDETCTCFVRDGKTYCKRDYIRLFGTKCARCAGGFSSSDLVMRARGHVYHLECFRCAVCSRQLLPGDEFSLRDRELLCRADHRLLREGAASAESPPRSPGHLPGARPGPLPLPVEAPSMTLDLVAYLAGLSLVKEGGPLGVLASGGKEGYCSGPQINIGTENSLQESGDGSFSPLLGGRVCSLLSRGRLALPPRPLFTPAWTTLLLSADAVPGRQPSLRSHVHKQAEKTTRVRTVLNEKQLHTLRTCYAANPRPDALMKEQLVEMTGLSPRVIRVWFQNKRCKDKKKSILMKQLQQQQHSDKASLQGLTGTPLVAGSPIRHDSAVQGSAVEVQTYQPPWKALSNFALQSDLDQPAFQQLLSISESGSLGNSSGSDVTSLSSQLPDTPNSMVPSPVET
ncbi:hypothetical protein Chor_014698 [Crotalus horridus]